MCVGEREKYSVCVRERGREREREREGACLCVCEGWVGWKCLSNGLCQIRIR